MNPNNSISFYNLIINQEKVEIPIIQRDYAQGREDKAEIRENFLNTIHDNLRDNIPLKLDFIYGSKVDDAFQPLDGQQRLTTLFLLHWYAAVKEKKLSEAKSLLLKFSYETRITSREFCGALVNSDDISINTANSLKSQIINSKWFFLSWKNDATIDAMLRTLDAIHVKFYSIEHIWEKLTDTQLISFYNIDLENIGLTDDLYIKMNARGKLLTSFENFKASFEKYINDLRWDVELNSKDTFAFKIDTKWTDFFWTYFRKNNKIDIAFMRFISTLLMFRLAIEKNSNRGALISNLHENPTVIKPEWITEDSYRYIYRIFELYSSSYNKMDLKLDFQLFRHKPQLDFLKEVVFEENTSSNQINSASYTQKVLFFAQTEYLLKNQEFDKSKFLDWMRVIKNIISRGNIEKGGKRPDVIRSVESFDGVINLIVELSEGCADIYTYLISKDKLSSSFAKEQIEEERNKAKIIIKYPDFSHEIYEMEDLPLFRGRIDFVFKCIKYDYNVELFYKDKFIKVKEIIKEHFNDDINDEISHNVRRALLTIENEGIYNFYDYWSSYWYVGDATKRCLIENFRELEYYIYNTEYQAFLIKLINKLENKTLDSIINDFIPPPEMPNWKTLLIKEKKWLDDYGGSKYIAIDENNDIAYLLKSKRPRDMSGCIEIR